MTMIRSSSPAMSEISVGSPSPPPSRAALYHIPHKIVSSNGFPLVPMIKRLKPPGETVASREFPPPLPQRRKSSNERVKSFSIADILGKKEDTTDTEPKKTDDSATATLSAMSPIVTGPPTVIPNIPVSHPPLQVVPRGSLLMLDLPTLHKVIPSYVDPSHLAAVGPPTGSPVLPLHPFFPPALLHYEQRLAWDYQRQLQEHFHAQAQLLRQMSMDPNIIPSEDGSERGGSRDSSSGGSRCCSPEVNVASEDGDEDVMDNETNMEDCMTSGETEGSSTKSAAAKTVKNPSDTPLDALFQLSTKNFDEDQDPATLNIFATRPNPKKKRKSRTAFTNHQIFELEKRFLYQKYLSPADRDEIAAGLGLSNAQVITWFQNRRAKLKRDMEELKKDVESVKQLSAHKSFLENVNDLSILKTRPVSRHHQPPSAAAAAQQHTEVIHTAAAVTHGIPGTSTGATTAAGPPPPPSSRVQLPQPTAAIQTHIPRHQPHVITINTCNEIRERQHINDSAATRVSDSLAQRRIPTESGTSTQVDGISQELPNHHRHGQQQPARNTQIITNRG